ncbi:MAG: mechanosensitive ion channel family protein [Candidatus Zeuxoniibacter abyssi]|nr:MAG: mechanosensitive ion channel family protein [Candidatus Persebacteraceae bacterium AB1(2)]
MGKLYSFINENLWLAESGFILTATAIILVMWLKIRNFLKIRAEESKSPWDDIWAFSLHTPMTLLIVVVGLEKTIAVLVTQFPKYQNVGEFSNTAQETLFTIAIFWVLWRLISGMERHYKDNTLKIGDKNVDSGSMYSIFRIFRAAVLVIATLTLMEALGASISGILAFGGIGGVIIGFAAQNTLSNFFSGMVIFWERPFVIGDWIRCPNINVEGVVEDIGWRMTQIRTFDHRPLYVPNALFSGNVIENPQRMTNRRIYEYMGLRYDDIDKMESVLADVRTMLKEHDGIDQEKIQMAHFDRYGASSVDFFIYVMTSTTQWTKFHDIKSDVLLRIAAIVKKHGAEFAFPTHTVHHQLGASQTPPPPIENK